MHWLRAAIARLAGSLQRRVKATALPTPAAGLASLGPTTKNGNDCFVLGTHRQRQLAKQAVKRDKKHALKTKRVVKRTPDRAPAKAHIVRQSGALGH